MGLGTLLSARLFIGHRGVEKKELPMDKNMITRSELFNSNGRIDLLPLSQEGQIPAAALSIKNEGHCLIVMDKDFNEISLSRDKFESYLKHEHQIELLSQRKGSSNEMPETERYARCMKTLTMVGSRMEKPLHDQVTGQKLEILIHRDPFECRPGESIEVSVFFEGLPLVDRYVTAYRLTTGDDDAEQVEKTDKKGTACFKIDKTGIWLVRLVHIYPCVPGDDLKWESYWSAFCFEIPENTQDA